MIDEPNTAPVWSRARQNRVLHKQEEEGVLEVFMPANDLVITAARGHLSEAMAKAWEEVCDPFLEAGQRPHTFHDWEHLTSYQTEARKRLTSWVLSRHKNILSAHFLVASRIVAMGVSTASVVTSLAGLKMTATSVRAELEAELARKI